MEHFRALLPHQCLSRPVQIDQDEQATRPRHRVPDSGRTSSCLPSTDLLSKDKAQRCQRQRYRKRFVSHFPRVLLKASLMSTCLSITFLITILQYSVFGHDAVIRLLADGSFVTPRQYVFCYVAGLLNRGATLRRTNSGWKSCPGSLEPSCELYIFLLQFFNALGALSRHLARSRPSCGQC